MGNSASVTNNKRVVVVGGGYVGGAVAKELDKKFDVTVIEPQDHTYHKIAALRAAVVPGWEKRATIPLDKLLKKGKILRDKVTSIDSNQVTLSSGTTVEADYIVLAHGQGPMTFPSGPLEDVTDMATLQNALREHQAKISRSENIVIIGGGPVGVELAGEICAHHPGKKVTLVHSHSKLLNNTNPPLLEKGIQKVQSSLEAMGCTVRLGARVNSLPPTPGGDSFIEGKNTLTLSDGSTIEADLTVVTVGPGKKQGNLVDAVDENNRVIVDEYLRVKGYSNVFCVGDANNHPETKLAFTGGIQGLHVAKNIVTMEKGKRPVPYSGMDKKELGIMLIPLGPKKGVAIMEKNVMGDGMAKLIKSKGLFSKKQFEQNSAVLPQV